MILIRCLQKGDTMRDEYFDDIGLGSYYERRSEEDLKEWERFKKMRTDHDEGGKDAG